MYHRGLGDNSFQVTNYSRQPVITVQLFKAAANMQHIDELFLWLAQTMVQSFKVQVAEMWAVQAGPTGKLSVYLRTLVREDTTLPPYPVANEHVAALVGNLLSNRNDYTLWAVGEIFSSHQSSLLRRYGL